MIIRKKQLAVFQEYERQKFIRKSKLFIKENFNEYYSENEEQDIAKLINKCIDYGYKYDMKKEISVQKLIYLQIEFKLFEEQDDRFYELLEYTYTTEENKLLKLFNHLQL